MENTQWLYFYESIILGYLNKLVLVCVKYSKQLNNCVSFVSEGLSLPRMNGKLDLKVSSRSMRNTLNFLLDDE